MSGVGEDVGHYHRDSTHLEAGLAEVDVFHLVVSHFEEVYCVGGQ